MNIDHSCLANGLQVVSIAFRDFESAVVAIMIRAGSRVDGAAHGTAHFLEHMAFKGTRHHASDEITQRIESLGATINAVTSKDYTLYYVEGLKEMLPEAVAILAEGVISPRLDPEDIDVERQIILQEILQAQDDAAVSALAGLAQRAYPDQSLGKSVLGTPETVARLSRADLMDFVVENYQPENMILIAAGGISHHDLVVLANRFLDPMQVSSRTRKEAPKAAYSGGLFLQTRSELSQSIVACAFPTAWAGDRHRYAVQVLAEALGTGMSSPLFRSIRRDHSLAYEVGAWSEHGSDYGLFGMYAATAATHVEDALRLMGIELSKMAAADNDEAVHRGRNKCLVNLVRARETPFDAARMVGTAMLSFGTIVSPEDEINRIRSVTTRDVREAASTLIDMAKPTIAVVGQPDPLDYEEVMLTAIRSVLGSTSSDR